MIAAITGRGLRPPAANGRARRKAGALLVASAVLSAIAVVSAPAETLRIGKAGRDAFSFVPADIGRHERKRLASGLADAQSFGNGDLFRQRER